MLKLLILVVASSILVSTSTAAPMDALLGGASPDANPCVPNPCPTDRCASVCTQHYGVQVCRADCSAPCHGYGC
ncbi:unnamed protein product, partial [Mesorhabditis belari]|uniref:Uncharacterized protein n=1 Tax=Mesorhabditis belari TaxID=2138241 RepID=A0AAF3F3N2_9BILA